ncbi:MAG: hypothetical protein FWF57_01690 [Defluviitaleaceae bacterium]|nr:hypothetical protein [Defluviitaleaceae bacterium]
MSKKKFFIVVPIIVLITLISFIIIQIYSGSANIAIHGFTLGIRTGREGSFTSLREINLASSWNVSANYGDGIIYRTIRLNTVETLNITSEVEMGTVTIHLETEYETQSFLLSDYDITLDFSENNEGDLRITLELTNAENYNVNINW